MYNFHPLDVVGRGSKTQFQVGEHLNKIALAGERLSNIGENGESQIVDVHLCILVDCADIM